MVNLQSRRWILLIEEAASAFKKLEAKLDELKEQGLITEEEHNQLREQALGIQ